MTSPYTIRPARERDIDILIEFTRREAAEAERLMLSVEEAAAGVRAAFGDSPRAAY